MTYQLAIGDRMYSSWSLRGWLLFAAFDIPADIEVLHMYSKEFGEALKKYGNARTVPALRVTDGDFALWDTLAIAEMLAERHPDKALWPQDDAARALARTLTAEMHSGFTVLRDECTMNLRHSYSNFPVSDGVKADLARLEQLWENARETFGVDGPWLFGQYSIADAFYAPVATRIATYKLKVSATARAYAEAHLNHTIFRQWRARAFAGDYRQEVYELDYDKAPWPGPKPLAAKAVATGEPINTACPYSGDLVREDSLADIDGTIVGFCKPFCRDKSVVDPEAWPKLMALLGR